MSRFKLSFLSGVFVLLFAICILLLPGCAKDVAKPNPIPSVDTTVYTTVNFNDLLLDSMFVDTFFVKMVDSATVKSQVSQFYKRRNYQFAWFNKNGPANVMAMFYDQLKNYSFDFNDQSLDNPKIDSLVKSLRSDESKFMSNPANVLNLELLLTSTYFKYARKVYDGRDKNPVDLEWFIPRKKKDYQILLDSLVARKPDSEVHEPENIYYTRLKAQLRKYREIEKSNVSYPVITDKKVLIVGDTDVCIINVKKNLIIVGDLMDKDTSAIFTDTLKSALLLFQGRMGLFKSGKLTESTRKELNVSISDRIKQMVINLERLRWVPVDLESDYLMVNIPEFRLHIFEKNKLAWEMNVVVGKAATKTSIFKGNIANIVLNPYWNVPNSIIKNEIIPAMKRNANYIERNNMEITNKKPLMVRQKPGGNNALGKIKFLFPNNFSIYLHDTPSKSLFSESKRDFSHGCIRVEEPRKLAKYLLRDQPNWLKRIDKILNTIDETWIKVSPTVPVYIVYFTSWVDSEGKLNFRNDIYGHDKKLANEIFGVGKM